MNDPSGRFWKPLLALLAGYLVVGIYLVGFHFPADESLLVKGFNLWRVHPVNWPLCLTLLCTALPLLATWLFARKHFPLCLIGSIAVFWLAVDAYTGQQNIFQSPLPHYYDWNVKMTWHEAIAPYANFKGVVHSNGSQNHPPIAFLQGWVLAQVPVNPVIWNAVYFLLTVLGGAFTYLLSRELFGEKVGRLSGALYALVPSLVAYSSVNMDALYPALTALALWRYLLAARTEKMEDYLWAGGSLVLLGAFSFNALPLLALVTTLFFYRRQFHRLLPFAVSLLPFVLFGLFLWNYMHFNYLAAISIAAHRAQGGMLGIGRSWLFIFIGPLIFFICMSLPLAAGALTEIFRAGREDYKAPILIMLSVLFVSGTNLGEIERVWLFLVPLLLPLAGKYWMDAPWPVRLIALLLVISQSVLFANILRFAGT